MMFDLSNEELAGKGDIDRDIAVHSVLTQHINTKFLARLRKSPMGIECQDIGEDSAPFRV